MLGSLKGKFNSRDHTLRSTLAMPYAHVSTTLRGIGSIMKDPRRAPAWQLSAWLSRSLVIREPAEDRLKADEGDEAPGGFCSTNDLRD